MRLYIAASAVIAPSLAFASATSYAIGIDALRAELGAAMPTGAGVPVDHIEASITAAPTYTYRPDTTSAEFAPTIFTFRDPPSASASFHATAVGSAFYGAASGVAPGITKVNVYQADYWLTGSTFLKAGSSSSLTLPALPLHDSGVYSRVANNSWTGTPDATYMNTYGKDILRRTDWVVNTDDEIIVCGTGNGSGTAPPLLASAFNVITVGLTSGNHQSQTTAIDTVYTAGRTKPDLVAPADGTSYATPLVSGAAALLVQVGHNNPALSNNASRVSPRTKLTIYDAETSEVIKATLMAGAYRRAIPDYRATSSVQSANGLDTRYGAGQLNVYNSYHILTAGERHSIEDGGPATGAATGFDYDKAFGGSAANSTASYVFSTDVDQAFTASLVWNLAFTSTNVTPTNLYNLDLHLLDITSPQSPLTIATSSSTLDNTENLNLLLNAGHTYKLQVLTASGQKPFSWDYGLAWQAIGATAWQGGSGDWLAASNWSQGAPTSNMDAVIDNGGTVQFSTTSPVQIHSLRVGAKTPVISIFNQTSGSFTITDRLVIGDQAGAIGYANIQGGTLTTPLIVAGNAGTGTFTVALGASVNAGSITGGGSVYSGGRLAVTDSVLMSTASRVNIYGGTLSAKSITAGTLNISTGATVALIPHTAGYSKLSTLHFDGTTNAWGGKFDLADNTLAVLGGSLSDITDQVKTGRKGGTWDGTGISSTTAAGDSLGIYGLAVVQNTLPDGTLLLPNEPANAIVVKYALIGDTNFDGVIGNADFFQINRGLLTGGNAYAQGDFNYDGTIDAADYNLINRSFLYQGKSGAAGSGSMVVAPEPAALSILATGLLCLLPRRRRSA